MYQRVISVLLVILAYGVAAGATEVSTPSTVYGLVGYGNLWGDESSLGKGLTYGGGFEYRPWERIGFALDVTGIQHHRSTGTGVTFSGDGVSVTGNVVFHFEDGGFGPYLRIGAGVLHSSKDNRWEQDGESWSWSTTGAIFVGAGGVNIPLTERLALRPELSGVFSIPTLLEHLHLSGSVALSYRF